MRLRSLVLAIMALFLESFVSCRENITLALYKLAEKYRGERPPDLDNLVNNIQANTHVVNDRLKRGDFSKFADNFPEKVIQELEAIRFSDSVTTHTFDYKYQLDEVAIEEAIGVATLDKKDENFMRVALVIVRAIAEPKHHYISYEVRECRRKWGIFRRCHTIRKSKIEYLNTKEIEIAQKGLAYTAYNELLRKVGVVNLKLSKEDGSEIVHFEGEETFETFNKNQTVLELGNVIYSVDRKKKVTLTKNGQLFVGDASFNPITNLNEVNKFGTLIGSKKKRSNKPFSLKVNDDGNLIITDGKTVEFLSSNKNNKGKAPYIIAVSNDGNLILYDSKHRPLYDLKGRFKKGEFILPQDLRIYSKNGEYFLILQPDGRLVSYKSGHGKTEDTIVTYKEADDLTAQFTPPFFVVVEKNGQAKGIDSQRKVMWKSKTKNKGIFPFKLRVTDDGHVNLIDRKKKVLWEF